MLSWGKPATNNLGFLGSDVSKELSEHHLLIQIKSLFHGKMKQARSKFFFDDEHGSVARGASHYKAVVLQHERIS